MTYGSRYGFKPSPSKSFGSPSSVNSHNSVTAVFLWLYFDLIFYETAVVNRYISKKFELTLFHHRHLEHYRQKWRKLVFLDTPTKLKHDRHVDKEVVAELFSKHHLWIEQRHLYIAVFVQLDFLDDLQLYKRIHQSKQLNKMQCLNKC